MEALSILLIAISLIILIRNLEAICYITIISSLIIWATLHCLEQHQFWTLRFRLSLSLPNLVLIPTTAILLLLSKLWILQAFSFSPTSPSGRIPQDLLTFSFNFSTVFTSKFVDNFDREARASFFLKAWNFSDTTKEAILLLRQIAGKVQHVAEHIDYHVPRALLQIDGALTTLDTIQRISVSLATIFFVVLVAWYIVPVVLSRQYLRLRWKAWTGPRRSCIVPQLTRYIGDEEDWKHLAWVVQTPTPHPVERFSSLFSTTPLRISANPIDLLKACQNSDKAFLPKSSTRASVYEPAIDGESSSLLWGPKLGFHNRCSIDILTIPPSLLTYRPTFGPGLDGRAICLAYGILSRNKGPKPWSLVCNLHTSDTIKIFEENSVQWPRPHTCFRSLYHAEFTRTFSSLGTSFVVSATELALLLADTDEELIEDWLDGGMEQQDLVLNKRAAELGASAVELDRLYRGQYGAMLVSLAVYRKGERIRPEILVYEALCRLEGVDVEAQWVSDASVEEWKEQEVRHVGSAGLALISAII